MYYYFNDVDTSVKTLSSVSNSTNFPALTFSPFLSDIIITPTPTVLQGKLNTINEMKLFINEYRLMFIT